MGEFAEEDKIQKEKIEARNGLEHAAYGLKNQLADEENEDALSEEDRETLETAVNDLIDWLDSNQDAEKEEYEEKKEEFMATVQPLAIQKLHREVEKAKRALSTSHQVRVEV